MKIILEGERPWSWNKMYAGVHWSERKKEADRVHELVRVATSDAKYSTMWCRVDIHITAYFDKRPLDSSNICAKMYEDGLIKAAIIVDDSPEWVRKVTVQSEIDKDNPRVEIKVNEIA